MTRSSARFEPASSPASLLWHSHNEQLWDLQSTLLRGDLQPNGDGWIFIPRKLVAHGSGLQGALNMMVGCRRTASRYLRSRGLARPKVPWDQINAVK